MDLLPLQLRSKVLISLLFLLYNAHAIGQEINIGGKWKFKTGDSLIWVKSNYNDKEWREILVGKNWETEGLEKYDGFAYYRRTVVVPSSLKKSTDVLGALTLNLGSIDDADHTYFNGELVGETGKMPPDYQGKYNVKRKYTIPAHLIKWDKENLIVVRVYDGGGGGGLYEGPFVISPISSIDFIQWDYSFEDKDGIFLDEPAIIKIAIHNKGNRFAGVLKEIIKTDKGEVLKSESQNVVLEKNSSKTIKLTYKPSFPGFYFAEIILEADNKTSKSLRANFGFNPEENIAPTDYQKDFQEYWNKARKELSDISPEYKMIKTDSLSTPAKDIYLVEMKSLENVLIRGWYSVPKKPGRYPALLQVQGYSSIMGPEKGMNDFAVFSLNIRGHGNSRSDVNPEFPGYLQYNLGDKNKYIYRGAYMDCLRAVDFICSRSEVDTTKIAVEGGSQGGALSFATAALDKRIKACVPMIPFLSDFPNYFKVAYWPGNEFKDYVEKDRKGTWRDVYYVLSYIDIKNLAMWIKCPLLMSVGLQDDTCPPHINFAAYNNVKSEKEYYVYPKEGHSAPEEFYLIKNKWLKEKLMIQ